MAKARGTKPPEPRLKSGALHELKDWQAILVIIVVVAIFFRDILLRNAFFWEDFIYQYYAFRNFAAVSLAHGTLPLWNPFTFSGMPFQADIQTALFYIPNLLLTLFVNGDRLPFYWLEVIIIAHFVVAGVSMYYFAKDLGLEKTYALFSAVAFTLSGFMIMQVIHQTFICQVAWTPLVLLLLRRTLHGRSVRMMVLTGLVLGHAILAGSPQFTVYIFLLVFFYFLFEWFGIFRQGGLKSSVPAIVLAAGVVVLAIALTAIQLLPTLELAPLSKRATISFENSAEGSLRWEQALTLVAPKYFGSSGARENTYSFPTEYWSYWETCLYVGILPLVMLALSLSQIKKNRYVAFFAFILLFGVLYSLGKNFFLHALFFNFVPGFDKFRIPGRMSFFFTIAASVLAGFGLRYAIEQLSLRNRDMWKFLIVLAGSGVAFILFAQLGLFQVGAGTTRGQNYHETAVSVAAGAMGLLVVAGILLHFMMRQHVLTTMAVLTLIAFHVIDMNVFGFDQNNGRLDPDLYYARTAQIVNPLKEEGKKEYFRVNSRDGGAMILDRNQGMIDRLFLLEGYTPLALQRLYPPAKSAAKMFDLLNTKYRIVVDPRDHSMGLSMANSYVPRAFFVYGDTVISDEQAVSSYMGSDNFDSRKTAVYEQKPSMLLGTGVPDSTASASITSYELNAISVKAQTARDGILVLSERYYPGWHAYVDGVEQPLYQVDYCLRAVPVKAGMHEISVRFEPASYEHGLIISLVTLSLAAIVIVVSYFTKRHLPSVPHVS